MEADVAEALKFGNHKGCDKFKPFLEKCLDDDVVHGYSLVITRQRVTEIPNLLIAPLNVHEQHTINEWGEIIDKMRMTHNLSKLFTGSDSSVNSRLDKQAIQECM